MYVHIYGWKYVLQVALITGQYSMWSYNYLSLCLCDCVFAHIYVCMYLCALCTFYIINHVMFQNAVMFSWLARQMPGQADIEDKALAFWPKVVVVLAAAIT